MLAPLLLCGRLAPGPAATPTEGDWPANIANLPRMAEPAGSPDRVIPGHDPKRFERYPTKGRGEDPLGPGMPALLFALRLAAVFSAPDDSIEAIRYGTPHDSPVYSIEAIRYGTIRGFPVSDLVMGAPEGETVDIAMVVWLIRGGGRNVLFDSGFHREKWMKEFPTFADYVRPDEAVRGAGVAPEDVTDVIVSHAHWDHMGGIDLFPKATVWVQRQEFAYYTGDAWQPGGRHGGIDPDDARELVRINTEGRLRLVDGDDREILPGIRAYTGARHTYASQYIAVAGAAPVVLASDNCYLYRNLTEHRASATFDEADRPANVRNQERMVRLAGSPDRVVPGHDAAQFERYPTKGRVAKIR